MKLRFQADADLKLAFIRAVLRREPSLDFQTAAAAGLSGLSDLEVLAIAAREDRLLISHDRKTMPHHFSEFMKSAISPGLIIVPQQMPIAAAAEELLLLWGASDPGEWVNRVCYLPL